MARTDRLLVALCFFLSGAAGLVAEVVWSRRLELVFGSTSQSIATVVATYMAGLGLGSLLFGRIADRARDPARLYARLELAIGAFAVLSPVLLDGVGAVFLGLDRWLAPGPALAAAIKLVLAVAVLGIPTLLMGGTLPALARYLHRGGDDLARGVGLLYGLNTLGAVAGSALAGFWLIERFGLFRTLVFAALLNGSAAVLVLGLVRRRRAATAAVPPASAHLPGLRELVRSEAFGTAARLAFLAGFGSLAAEIAWSRALALVFGSSTWSFTLVLVAFLTGIGLGSAWYARRGLGGRPASVCLAHAQLLAAIGVLLFLAGFERLERVFVVLQQNPLLGAGGLLAIKAVLALAVLLPATLGMGVSFPLVMALAPRREEAVASEVGVVYLANTAGAILGSLVAGFFLITSIGTFATLRIAALVHLGAAGVALLFPVAEGTTVRGRRPAALVAVAIGVLLFLAPAWPPHLLSLGTFLYGRTMGKTRLALDSHFARARSMVLSSREGLSSVVSVWQLDYSRSLRVSGKTDASSGVDMATQIELALRPLFAHPAPRRVLVIGAGSGVTVWAAASFPGVERIDLVEIEPAVLEALPWFESVNGAVWRDPRVHTTLADGRNFLLTSGERWDVIISEPSNPWMAGVANLFTGEFYSLVRAHLAPGGRFSQWLQPYDISDRTLRRMVATLVEGFPASELWASRAGDLVVLAGMEPARTSVAAAHSWFTSGVLDRLALRATLRARAPEDLLVGHVLDRDGMLRFVGSARPLRDDPPELEFAVLRTLGETRWGLRVRNELLAARGPGSCSFATVEPLPAGFSDYSDGRIRLDWREPGQARPAFLAGIADAPSAIRAAWLGDAERELGNWGAARVAYETALALDSGDLVARLRLAEASVAGGDLGAAAEHLARIRPSDLDVEAHLAVAEVALRGGDLGRALPALEAAGTTIRRAADAADHSQRLLDQCLIAGSHDRARLPDVVALLDRLFQASPQVFDLASAAAQLSEGMGDAAATLARYEAVLATAPELVALAGRARCLASLGRLDEALTALDDLRRYEPWSVEAARIERKILADPAWRGDRGEKAQGSRR